MIKPALSLCVLAGAAGLGSAFAAQPPQASMEAQAKVSQAQATRTALARVPGAKVQSAELEREHGRLVWSFDLGRAGQPGTTEIQVDALTGKIVSQKAESAAQEAAEAASQAQEK